MNFQQEYLCKYYEESEEEKYLRKLAVQYHNETESYDRAVCTGPIKNGCVMPNGPIEHSMISEHAREVERRLLPNGYDRKRWKDMISRTSHSRYP